jgi:hypothetical protein
LAIDSSACVFETKAASTCPIWRIDVRIGLHRKAGFVGMPAAINTRKSMVRVGQLQKTWLMA